MIQQLLLVVVAWLALAPAFCTQAAAESPPIRPERTSEPIIRLSRPTLEIGSGPDSAGTTVKALSVIPMDGSPASVIIASPGTKGVRFVIARMPDDARAVHIDQRLFDPAHSRSDVLITWFTIGAHCCTRAVVFSLLRGRWVKVDLGAWDGDALPPPVLDVPGQPASFVWHDNAFLGAFTGHAASAMPLKILSVVNGRAVDVSAYPRHRARHQAWTQALREPCETPPEGVLHAGFCAAYVASAARTGGLAEAWRVMLAHQDPVPPGGYVMCDRRDDSGCRTTLSFPSYPEALRWFLVRHGYVSAQAKLP